MDVIADGSLLLAFLSRAEVLHIDMSEPLVSGEDGSYSPESSLIAMGLLFGWLRALWSVLTEYKKPFVLLEIVRVSFARDIVNFLLVQLAMWLSFSLATTALYVHSDGESSDSNAGMGDFFSR